MKRRIDGTWASQPGCKGQPLFNVPLENVIIDELHLLLRITDRLEHGIILEVIGWDQVFRHIYYYAASTKIFLITDDQSVGSV